MAALQQILHGVAQVQLHRQLRVLTLEVRHDRHDVLAAEFSGRRHPQQTTYLTTAVRQQRFRLFDFVEYAQHARVEQGAFLGQRLAPRGPLQQAHADALFQLRHAFADHRQRQVHLPRGGGHAASADDAGKSGKGG
jgi:hypothetical protein